MADADEAKIAGSHVAELGSFFNAHDQWLFGHACVRTNGDRPQKPKSIKRTRDRPKHLAGPASASNGRQTVT
jgi:hypothetical protein